MVSIYKYVRLSIRCFAIHNCTFKNMKKLRFWFIICIYIYRFKKMENHSRRECESFDGGNLVWCGFEFESLGYPRKALTTRPQTLGLYIYRFNGLIYIFSPFCHYIFLQHHIFFFTILLFYSHILHASVRLFMWSVKWELGFCSFQFDKWKLTY